MKRLLSKESSNNICKDILTKYKVISKGSNINIYYNKLLFNFNCLIKIFQSSDKFPRSKNTLSSLKQKYLDINQLIIIQRKLSFSSFTYSKNKDTINSKESIKSKKTNIKRENIKENEEEKSFLDTIKSYYGIDFKDNESFCIVLRKDIKKKDEINRKYLYFVNGENRFLKLKTEIIKNLILKKRNLNSLNDNNGSGKPFLLDMFPYFEEAKTEKSDIFLSKAVTLTSFPTSESLLRAILKSI